MNDLLDEITHPTDFDVAPDHRSVRERAKFAPIFVGGLILAGLAVALIILAL